MLREMPCGNACSTSNVASAARSARRDTTFAAENLRDTAHGRVYRQTASMERRKVENSRSR